MGDEVQAIKAGLLEVADIVVVNKGDRPGAQRTVSQLRAMLVAVPRAVRAGEATPAPRAPEVLLTTATTGDGVEELIDALDRHRATSDGRERARRTRAEAQVWAIVADRLQGQLRDGSRALDTSAVIDAVAAHDLDPYSAADTLLARLREAG
jgi:LAO/AO transport system kinase